MRTKKMVLFIILFLLAAVVGFLYLTIVQRGGSGGNGGSVSAGTVSINGRVFAVEVAKSLSEQSKGLSGRESLPENNGMLFIFGFPAKRGFWMKGMNFPLDIIWIKNYKIIGIEKNISIPASISETTNLYYPPEPVDKVLEINGGLSDKLDIKVGDKVEISL